MNARVHCTHAWKLTKLSVSQIRDVAFDTFKFGFGKQRNCARLEQNRGESSRSSSAFPKKSKKKKTKISLARTFAASRLELILCRSATGSRRFNADDKKPTGSVTTVTPPSKYA